MDNLQVSSQKLLRSFVERIERIEESIKEERSDINDLYLEAKGKGFDVKILRKVIALRKKGKEEREQEQALIDTYMGVFETTPLGAYASRYEDEELATASP